MLERTRPWGDRSRVERGLRDWASRHDWPPLGAGEASVAAELHRLGGLPTATGIRNARPPGRQVAAEATVMMLRNVAAGREAMDYGLLGVQVTGHGIPDRTIRRYMAQPGAAPLMSVLNRIARDGAMAHLVAGGRSPVAARAWLRRHPGTSPMDARLPRGSRR